MSMLYGEARYKEIYAKVYAELKAYGLTDQEADLITTHRLAPSGQRTQAAKRGLTLDQFYEIYQEGARKYLANGGTMFWQH